MESFDRTIVRNYLARRTQNAIKQEYGWSFYLLLTIRGNDCFKGPSKRRQLLPRLFEVRHSSLHLRRPGRKWVEIGPSPRILHTFDESL